jgi:hypothetical protein
MVPLPSWVVTGYQLPSRSIPGPMDARRRWGKPRSSRTAGDVGTGRAWLGIAVLTWAFVVERVTGIEPALSAWNE